MKTIKKFIKQNLLISINHRILSLGFLGVLLFSCDKTEVPLNIEPSCTITSPHEGDEIDNYNNVIIEVDADDSDGFILKAFPITMSWKINPLGPTKYKLQHWMQKVGQPQIKSM